MRELKQITQELYEDLSSRTPPGVRELKLDVEVHLCLASHRRTPPGVRELKQPRQPDGLWL